jgi:hypothetical protein
MIREVKLERIELTQKYLIKIRNETTLLSFLDLFEDMYMLFLPLRANVIHDIDTSTIRRAVPYDDTQPPL